jgi:hypothetical protein
LSNTSGSRTKVFRKAPRNEGLFVEDIKKRMIHIAGFHSYIIVHMKTRGETSKISDELVYSSLRGDIDHEYNDDLWKLVALTLASLECSLVLKLIQDFGETEINLYLTLQKHILGVLFIYIAIKILKRIHMKRLIRRQYGKSNLNAQ